uniref:EGF-like domain-containing protein n=1 Tax=Xiphophorus couchianus TaxID=32473 RepID=A0A3B5L833_9TELE
MNHHNKHFNGGTCINTPGSFYCNCTPGFVGQRCTLRPVVVPDMQAGHAVVGKEELIGITGVLFVIIVLIVLFIAFRKKVFNKNYSRNNLSLVQDPATAALLNKANSPHHFHTQVASCVLTCYKESKIWHF